MYNQGGETYNLRLLFVGDVMLGRHVNRILQSVPPEYPWGDTLPLFQWADACICNLECALADVGEPWSLTPKVFHFRSAARNVAVLQRAHISAVSLANNHALDFGYDALLQTLDVLRGTGIHYAGAGETIQEAARPAIWESSGTKLGLIALTDNEPIWEATQECAGVYYMPINLEDERAQRLLDLVRQTRAQVDRLIVSAHWGPNWGHAPPAEQIPFAHALIDAGADIIFGHSGHIVRGIEIYRGRPIIYCAGDFIDDYAIDPAERNDLSFIFTVDLTDQAITHLRLYPTIIKDFQARRAVEPERTMIVARMQHLCASLHTTTLWGETEGCLEIPLR